MDEKFNNKQIKRIRFWLLRVLDEKTTDLNRISKRIGTISYQAENFIDMRNYKDQHVVIFDLLKEMKNYGWEDSVKELIQELDTKE